MSSVPSSAENLSTTTKRGRVLVADDEPDIAKTLKLILAQEGFQVAAVLGGQAAVHVAREWHPDLFLSDVVMPDMNGIDAAIEITQHLPDCRILLMSGNAVWQDLMSEARKRGYDFPVLLKPIHPRELIKEVNAALHD